MNKKIQLIRDQNDAFRTTYSGGYFAVSNGIKALPENLQNKIHWAVMRDTNFSAANDPYETHDFGIVIVDGTKANWKIDYYDKDMHSASNDPSDPNVTERVLTVMLPIEY